MQKKVIEILVGIPCSGKSTYAIHKHVTKDAKIISRDDIRENIFLFDQPFEISKQNEIKVTEYFDDRLIYGLRLYDCAILDNTHCKEKYIDSIINTYGKDYDIRIIFFDIGLLKAHYRNIVRRIKTGKWIPISIMNNMHRNYNKINRNKYARYMDL